uniref:BCAR1 scaffold protein, Cas family member n=1 Tax=Terrapene triunguis TaxID=2587831 RepID=A0A674K2A2_9SAUR
MQEGARAGPGAHSCCPPQVYDVPPSVSKDVPDGPSREETYDVPPAFAKPKALDLPRHPAEPALPEDVYDVPPAAGKGAPEAPFPQEIYDVLPGLRKLVGPAQDVYDVPRELHAGSLDAEGEYIYDVPPQVDREARAGDAKRLSASSTGSTRSNVSSSSLDVGPGKDAPKELGLGLDLDTAMELLARLQHHISGSVSYLMSFISTGWRSPEQLELHAPSLRAAAEGIKGALRDLLEFARGAVGNAAQASDRALHTKLSKQLQKMEDVYQALLRHSQALDGCGWAPGALAAGKPGGTDDLDRLVMYSRGIPDDTKQLASFLHGNASLLFRRGKPPADGPDTSLLLASHPPPAPADKASSIQSRPLPSPPKFLAQDSPDGPYENSESGWMEDYDYVHLQVGSGAGERRRRGHPRAERGLGLLWRGAHLAGAFSSCEPAAPPPGLLQYCTPGCSTKASCVSTGRAGCAGPTCPMLSSEGCGTACWSCSGAAASRVPHSGWLHSAPSRELLVPPWGSWQAGWARSPLVTTESRPGCRQLLCRQNYTGSFQGTRQRCHVYYDNNLIYNH